MDERICAIARAPEVPMRLPERLRVLMEELTANISAIERAPRARMLQSLQLMFVTDLLTRIASIRMVSRVGVRSTPRFCRLASIVEPVVRVSPLRFIESTVVLIFSASPKA